MEHHTSFQLKSGSKVVSRQLCLASHSQKSTLQNQAGKHELTLYFMCDSYLGCDQEYEFTIDVQPDADAA